MLKGEWRGRKELKNCSDCNVLSIEETQFPKAMA